MSYGDEGRGTALVLVHGFPLSRKAWGRQAGLPGCRVITPDLAGFGQSDARSGRVTMDQFADDVHALLVGFQSGPVILAGHSMGGYIALAFARKYPALLRGLVLVGTKAGPDTPEGAAGRRATADKVKAGGVGVVTAVMAPKMLAGGTGDPALVAAVLGMMAGATPEGVIGALLGMAERPDSTPWLATLTKPVLVVTGANDVLIPAAESEKLAAALPQATLRVIPEAGHLVAWEQPAAFNEALTGWVAGLAA